MTKPIADTGTIFCALIVFNLLLFFLDKTTKKYYFGQIILFSLTTLVFLIWRTSYFPLTNERIDNERTLDAKKNSGQVSQEVRLSTNKTENFIYSINRPIFQTAVFQTFLTFIFSLSGFIKTDEKKFFGRLSFVFGILSAILGFIYFLASSSPTGMVT